MFTEKFVQDLKSLIPHGEYFYSKYSPEFINSIQKEYLLLPKEDMIIEENCIVDLVNNYKSKYIRFGDYSFLEMIEIFNGHNIFCESSDTYLCFDGQDGKIMEFDRDDNSLIDYCAENSELFLKSILIIFKFSSDNMMGLINDRDKEREKIIKECSIVAGGNKYVGFFERALW